MSKSRAAFTLMEILVTLSIVVLIVGISFVSLSLIYADQATVDASDVVRSRWAMARSRAINDNVPYVFGVQWNESNWRVAPEGADYWGDGASTTQEGTSTS